MSLAWIKSQFSVCVLEVSLVQVDSRCPLCPLDTQPVSEELRPSLQPCDIKVEQSPVREETEIQEHPRVKEEQVDQCISPDMEADTSNNAELKRPKSEPTTDCDVNESINDKGSESDGSSSPRPSHKKPYFCAKCGKSFAQSSHLKLCQVQNECKITPEKGNTDENDKEEKAFKCSECNKEFNRKQLLVMHARVHTGEKPFSCDYCGKTFTQNSHRIVHMRQHTGEKPYFCEKCGKSFANSDLKVHMAVHESWKRHIREKLNKVGKKPNIPIVLIWCLLF
uniref:C2H2-type domain-containing protein n=1 Tax=Dicentrarchus labrax TaxID=13489 RepID=A0A8P4GE45_DICLA